MDGGCPGVASVKGGVIGATSQQYPLLMASMGIEAIKKYVETGEMGGKGSDNHKATVVGDTVGDPFKDTSSVAMNPVIKFTTLFGLLAVELAVKLNTPGSSLTTILAAVFFAISAFFVYRSFYGMRITGAK